VPEDLAQRWGHGAKGCGLESSGPTASNPMSLAAGRQPAHEPGLDILPRPERRGHISPLPSERLFNWTALALLHKLPCDTKQNQDLIPSLSIHINLVGKFS
jgi:hypothetical protein